MKKQGKTSEKNKWNEDKQPTWKKAQSNSYENAH